MGKRVNEPSEGAGDDDVLRPVLNVAFSDVIAAMVNSLYSAS